MLSVTWDPGGPWLSTMGIEILAPDLLGYHVRTRRSLAGLPLPHDSLFRRHRGTAVRAQVKERLTVTYDGLLSIHFSFIVTVSFIVTSWFSYGKSTLILGTLSQSESYPLVPVVDSVPGLGTNWVDKMAEIPGLV